MNNPENKRVPVFAPDGEPLMPTKASRARKMIESGKAEPTRTETNEFAVKLNKEPSGRETQDMTLGIDPGSKFTGMAVVSKECTNFACNLELPDYISMRMDKRRERRRNRRYRKTRRRETRFNNRTSSKLPPSIKARKQFEVRIANELTDIYPISDIALEDVAFNHFEKDWGKDFSPVEQGKKWLQNKLSDIAKLWKFKGWQTSRERKYLGLSKSSNKSKQSPEAHVNDAISLASLVMDKVGTAIQRFDVFRRPKYSRRKLHLEQPAKGGKRRRYGGTTTPTKFRKGDYVEATIADRTYRGWVSGYTSTENRISVSDFDWSRLGQFAISKTKLLVRNTGFLIKSQEVKACSSSQ